MNMPFNFNDSRIVSIKGHEDEPQIFTSVLDIANVVRRAIEFDGQWPETGGITGDWLSATQAKEMLENITGKSNGQQC